MPGRIVAVRGQVPFTAGPGIEITQNKAIQLFLKQTNNLLKISSDGELYSDLQLESGLTPSSTFPIGITVGNVDSTDGRSQDGMILNAKNADGDYIRRFYGEDGKLYFDGGSGTLTEMATGEDITEALSHLTKSDVGLGNVDNTSDLDKPISTATQTALDGKLSGLTILSYGTSTWNDFITAYNKNAIVYCRASSGSDPSTGTQGRMAFMAYINNATTPTEVEFQYYRSVSSHSESQQGDQVFVYKLTSSNGGTWTVTTREASTKITTGTGLTKLYDSGVLTLSNDGVLTVNGSKGEVTVNDTKVASTTPSNPTEGMLWYDTTNDVLKIYNGTSWDSVATGGSISDTAYGSGWDGQTTTAPSQNAVYDKISTMDTTIGDKANKVSSPTTDDLASLTSGGDIADSGIAKSTVELNTNKETGDVPTDNTTKYPSSHTVKKYVDDQVSAATAGAVSDAAYGSGWDGVTGIAPSKNAVYDKINAMDTTISGKQDTISDLETIRTGAGKGATAVQPNDNITTLTNNAGFITNAVNDLTNYYKKTETYTQAEVNALVQNFQGFEVVATLPTTDIKTNVIYLLGPTGSGADKYEEYVYVNSTWIKIGDTSVDLTNYFNKTTNTSDNITQGSTNLFVSSSEKNTWNGKQDALNSQTAYTSKGSATKVPQITTNNMGQVTGITEVDITHPSQIDNTQYGSSWNGVTDKAPTKDAVYDKINTMDTTIGGKADDSGVVHNTGNEDIGGIKTFTGTRLYINSETHFGMGGEPVDYAYGEAVDLFSRKSMIDQIYTEGVFRRKGQGETERVWTLPSDKSGTIALTSDLSGLQTTANLKTDLTDNSDSYYPSQKAVKTAVDSKQATLVSGTNIKTINNESILGSGNIEISGGNNYEAGKNITIERTIESDMKGPCPSGFHIPLASEWGTIKDIWIALGGGSSAGLDFSAALKIPIAGRRASADGTTELQDNLGLYWSSTEYNTAKGTNLLLGENYLTTGDDSSRSYAYSIRAIKNTPVIPDNTRTKLYGTSVEAGGIFWNATDGLISMSADGSTWVTIRDKNEGATTVWNNGDTLSADNAGKYYQRGNNYGFPFAGSVTTGSSQVDASGYGPGNYYSGSTFITGVAWDSSDNPNLWGGVTQGTFLCDGTINADDQVNINSQTEYNNLPASKNSDGRAYFISVT